MPLLWRYLLKPFIATICLTVVSIVCLAILAKAPMFGKFIAMGGSPECLRKLLIYQIPNIIPLALVIASSVGSTLIAIKLSKSGQLTAFRTGGLSLATIYAAPYFLSALLAILSLWISSEIVPTCRFYAQELLLDSSSFSSLQLLKSGAFPLAKKTFIDMKLNDNQHEAQDVILAFQSNDDKGITLFLAKELDAEGGASFSASKVSILSTSKGKESYDSLIIDQQNRAHLDLENFASMLFAPKAKSQDPRDYLNLYYLFKGGKKELSYYTAFCFRISLALLPILLTHVGLMFGTSIQRNTKKLDLVLFSLLPIFLLGSLFIAKTLNTNFYCALPLFILPPSLVLFITNYRHHQLARGR